MLLLVLLALPVFIWGLHSLSLWLDRVIWERRHGAEIRQRLDKRKR